MEEDTFWSSAEWDWNVEESDSADSSVKPKVINSCEILMENQECNLAEIEPKHISLTDRGFTSQYKDGTRLENDATESVTNLPTSQNWCEISLDGDLGKGLETNDRHASGEPALGLQQQANEGNKNETASSSFAYQLGMMVVSKAAEVVHNVSESGDKVEKESKAVEMLQEKLETAISRGEELFLELENAKQWISYHEGVGQNLNQQLDDATQRYVSMQKETELKLQASRKDTERLDTTLHTVKGENDKLIEKDEMSQPKIKDLENQVLLLSDRLAQKENLHKDPNTSLSNIMQECQTDQTQLVETSVQCTLKENDDSRLEDTTSALATANARCEKMRHRLMTSLESMKAQTSQMRTSRVALEDALNESRDTRQKLSEEHLKVQKTENELNRAKESEITLRNEIEQATEDAKRQNILLEEVRKSLEVAQIQGEEYRRKITAQSLVQNCIRDARQEIANFNYDQRIQEALSRCQDLAKEVDAQKTSNDCLQSSLCEAQAKEQEAYEKLQLVHAEKMILADDHKRSKQEVFRGKEEIQNLRITLEHRDLLLEDTRNDFNKLLHVKSKEADGLNRVIKNLESENSSLRRTIQEERNKRNASSEDNQRQCNSLQSQIYNITKELQSTKAENKELKIKVSETNAQYADLLIQHDAAKNVEKQLQHTQEELSRAEAAKSEMLAVTEEDRRAITAYDHALHNLREDCRGLDWICRDQHRRIVDLSRQNNSMRIQLADLATSENPIIPRAMDTNEAPTVLDTIVETEERDSMSKTPSSDRVLSVENSVNDTDRDTNLASGSHSSLNAAAAIRATSPCSSVTSTTKKTKSRKITTKTRGILPNRQRSRSNSTPNSERIPSLAIAAEENNSDCVFLPSQGPQIRLGIPMREEQFNEIAGNHIFASNHHKDFDHVNLSHDDGYASSTCVTPHRRMRRSSRNRPGTSTEHYYVTYDGATFDLATFSLAKMRQLTSTCPSTHTPDGMDAFFEFLAEKANELNNDPRWRGRHTLGESTDWLQLRNVYN